MLSVGVRKWKRCPACHMRQKSRVELQVLHSVQHAEHLSSFPHPQVPRRE
jgi:hypothetical protein